VDEAAFVAEGYGLEPRKVMENYFVVVGPPDDPAGVASASNPADALRAISAAGAPFLSRGDNSGTHKRELAAWDALDIDPQGSDWYQESAVNQGQNLLVASDKGAYTLVDSATMAILRNMVDLKEFVIDRSEPNVYTVTLVNPANNGRVNGNAGREFAEFVTGADAQGLIAQFGREEFGEALFVPLAGDSRAAVTP
jgi:tungstate transport system substrate-binding protein